MIASLVSTTALLGASAAELAAFGGKTTGIVDLLAAQSGSPVAYSVPKAWAIPAGQHAQIVDSVLRQAFDDLISGEPSQTVLMARSSATDELPGENPTLSVAVDKTNLDGSFSRFRGVVHRVGETKDTMGVLLMPMVGSLTPFADGAQAWGWSNVSFVGDTHHVLNPKELYVALASGLGTRVVEAGEDFIPVTVDRATGLITSFGSKSKTFLSRLGSSVRLPEGPADYRQGRADYFDLDTGRIVTRPLGNDHDVFGKRGGVLNLRKGRLTDEIPSSSSISSGRAEWLRFTPFAKPETLTHLVGAMTYLTDRFGRPLQIEGAFPSFSETTPVLYQLLKLPELAQENRAITLDPVHLRSSQAIGIADFTGPLIYFPETDVPPPEGELRRIDRMFSETGYILLLGRHDRDTVLSTPHCRLRLSIEEENMASHAITLSRFQMARDPRAGYVMAMEVTGASNSGGSRLAGVSPSRRIGPFFIFENTRLQASGSEVAVQLRTDRTSARAPQDSGFFRPFRSAWRTVADWLHPPSHFLYDLDRPLLDQVAQEQRSFIELMKKEGFEEAAIPWIRDRKKVEIDPKKNPRDYTLPEWVEAMIAAHEGYLADDLDRGAYEEDVYSGIGVYLAIFLRTLRKNAEHFRQTHPPAETPALAQFPTLGSFSDRERINNFLLYFSHGRGVRSYNLHPIMIRFRHEHPDLYARLAGPINEDGYGPGHFPDEFFGPLYEAYRYIAQNYTDLYDVQNEADLTG